MANTTPGAKAPQPKQVSNRASIAGGVLSIIALILSAIGSGLIHSNIKTDATGYDKATQVATAAADTTVSVTVKLIGVPFISFGIFLALLAILFTVLRLRKTKSGGLVLSVLWIILSVWAIKLAVAAFSLIKADAA